VPPREDFLASLRELADEYGTMLIFDEMITGFRHAMGGYQDIAGVVPDLTTLGKALGNGYPFSALPGRDEYLRELSTATDDPSAYFAGTYNGHTASMAAVIETLTQLDRRRAHEGFDRRRAELVAGIEDQAEDTGVNNARVIGCGGAFTTVFGPRAPAAYDDVLDLDVERFPAYRWEMVEPGVMAPSTLPQTESALGRDDRRPRPRYDRGGGRGAPSGGVSGSIR
jgi:glutamate-1-semialdehyde 2,1-aminomutase